MTVQEFISAYSTKKFMNTKQGIDEKAEWIRNTLEIKTYIPFAEKRALCEFIINACNERDEAGLVKVDSVKRYVVFTISIISKYTNLEFSSGEDEGYDSLDEYDMLCENDLLNPILAIIGDEYATCNNMLNMMMDDVIANNNTVEAVFGHTFSKVSDSLDDLIGAFADKVEEMQLDLNQINFDKYKWLLDLLPKK